MYNGEMRFAGIKTHLATSRPYKVVTNIEFHEVQNQKWQIMVYSGSAGGTLSCLLNTTLDADAAKKAILKAAHDARVRNEELIRIEVPGAREHERVMHHKYAAVFAFHALQERWKNIENGNALHYKRLFSDKSASPSL